MKRVHEARKHWEPLHCPECLACFYGHPTGLPLYFVAVVSSSLFFFFSPILSGQILDVYHIFTHDVALESNAGLKCAARGSQKIQDEKITQKLPYAHQRQSRDELCALFIPLQHLCSIGRHFTMLTFRLFPTDVTNCVVISLRNCTTHPVAFTTCCHQPLPTQKSIHIS